MENIAIVWTKFIEKQPVPDRTVGSLKSVQNIQIQALIIEKINDLNKIFRILIEKIKFCFHIFCVFLCSDKRPIVYSVLTFPLSFELFQSTGTLMWYLIDQKMADFCPKIVLSQNNRYTNNRRQ